MRCLRLEPEKAQVAAAIGGDDTDSIAFIAESLLGASYGTSRILERWLSVLEGRNT